MKQRKPSAYSILISLLTFFEACIGFLRYDSRRDAVMGWSRPVYSPLQLPLQAVERPLLRTKSGQNVAISPQEQQQQLYECFASALIAGRVMPRLKRFASALCVTPEGMLAGSRSGTFAVRAFVTELAKKDIASR